MRHFVLFECMASKSLATVLMLWAGMSAAQAEVLSSTETTTGDWAQGVTISAEDLSEVQAGDIISVTVTALNDWTPETGDAYWQYVLREAGGSWSQLEGFNGGINATGTYQYTLTEDNVTAIKENGLNVTGKYITFTTVELTTPEATTSWTLSTTEWTAGNWSSNGQVSIGDITGNTTIEDGDVLRIYVTDFDTESGTPSISLSYTKGDNWSWTDFETSYQYYNPATTTAYVDFQITGELLTTLQAEDTKSVLIRGSYYTGTRVEYIKADGYYVNLSDQYTALYLAGTADVNITRSLLAGFNTITLPFAATAEELTGSSEAYLAELSGVNTDDGTVLTFTKVDQTVANKPFLIYVASDVNIVAQEDKTISGLVDDWHNQTWSGDFCMQGNYTPALSVYQVNSKNCYVVSDEDAIAPTGSTATLNGMRAYFFDNSSNEVKANIRFAVESSADAIQMIDGQPTTNAIYYNLAGQRVSQPQHGIYVVAGRKVVVK